jgi:hypothetical protein
MTLPEGIWILNVLPFSHYFRKGLCPCSACVSLGGWIVGSLCESTMFKLISKVSGKFGDLEPKVEKICTITGNVDKLDDLLKKKNSINQMKFVRQTKKSNCFFEIIHLLGWLVGASNCHI